MAARRKPKSSRRAKAKKSKRRAKRAVAAKKSARKVAARKKVARKVAGKKAAPKRAAKQARRRTQVPAAETIVVDTIEQPVPGVVVVTETEYTVQQDDA